MSRGAAIVIWYKDKNIKQPVLLVGKESVYVRDLLDTNPRFNASYARLILDSEHFDDSKLPSSIAEREKLQAAKDFFSRQSALLESTLGIGRIQFDTPAQTSGGFSVNYRYLHQNYKRGVIKGKKEAIDSSPIQTIVREVSEELGINISER